MVFLWRETRYVLLHSTIDWEHTDVQTQLGKCWRAVQSRGSQTSCRFTPASSLSLQGLRWGSCLRWTSLTTTPGFCLGCFHSKRESARNKYLCNLAEQVTGTWEWPQGGTIFNSVGIPVDLRKCWNTAVTAVSTAFPLQHVHSSWVSQNWIANASTLSKKSPNQGVTNSKVRGVSSTLPYCLGFKQLCNHFSLHSRSTGWIIFSR